MTESQRAQEVQTKTMELGRASPTHAPPLKFADTITVLVGSGDEARSFIVYTSSIKHRSTFFAAACSDRWISSGTQKGSVCLPEDHPFIFDLYLECVYLNRVRSSDLDQYLFSVEAIPDYDHIDEAYARLIHLYILADKLGDCASANIVIDCLIDQVFNRGRGMPSAHHFRFAFENSPDKSSLRRFFVDCLVYNSTYSGALEMSEHGALPKAAISEAYLQLIKVIDRKEEDKVKDAFDFKFIKTEKGRYHQFDSLHPRPGEGNAADCAE